MGSCCKRGRKEESGQALVEFALVLPVLLILLLGIVDFGFAFHGLVTVNTAAREGARHGVVERNDAGITNSDTVVAAARKVTGTLPAEATKLKIYINGTEVSSGSTIDLPESGQDMTVSVTYDYDLITPLPNFVGISSPLTLTGQITMVRE